MPPAFKMWKAVTATFLLAVAARSEYVDPAVLDACSGYVASPTQLSEADAKAVIELSLKAPGCKVFGPDIERLRLTVDYETGQLSFLANIPLALRLTGFVRRSASSQNRRRFEGTL